MRTRKPGRRQDIAEAAVTVFTRQGYRLTQMADIAREAGVSAGALYSYVTGKEALFELALRAVLGDLPPDDIEIPPIGPQDVGSWLAAKLRATMTWPVLAEAVSARKADARIGPVILELIALVSNRRHLVWLLDRCANEIPELSGIYETEVRARYIADLTVFAGRCSRLAGESAGRKAATARAVMEMTVWMAMHRQRDRLPPACTAEEAHAAIVDIALGALAAPRS